MVSVVAQPVELVLKDTTERVDILVKDSDGNPVDVTGLHLRILASDERLIKEDDFFIPPVPPTRIVKPAGIGQYFFPFGAAAPNNETNQVGEFLFHWAVTPAVNTEAVNLVQVAKVVSARTMRLLPHFRLLIDKAVKLVDDDPDDPSFLGYTDSQLMMYLENGLTIWNMYEPYPTFASLDDFPEIYRQGLLEAGLLVGAMSQQLFAVDTDVPSYSDQGNTFVIQHQPALATFLSTLAQRLDKIIPIAKLKFVQSGSVKVEAGPNFRIAALLQMAPSGALFRNVFFAGAK